MSNGRRLRPLKTPSVCSVCTRLGNRRVLSFPVLGPLSGCFPLLSLRTNKADVVVGVDKGVAERLDSSGEKWRVDGRYELPFLSSALFLTIDRRYGLITFSNAKK